MCWRGQVPPNLQRRAGQVGTLEQCDSPGTRHAKRATVRMAARMLTDRSSRLQRDKRGQHKAGMERQRSGNRRHGESTVCHRQVFLTPSPHLLWL